MAIKWVSALPGSLILNVIKMPPCLLIDEMPESGMTITAIHSFENYIMMFNILYYFGGKNASHLKKLKDLLSEFGRAMAAGRVLLFRILF